MARLQALLSDYPELERLAEVRASLTAAPIPTWTAEWQRVALPVFADRTPK
jgi:hypothetical protein